MPLRLPRLAGLIFAVAIAPAIPALLTLHPAPALAEDAANAEKDAFEASKALGTAEAWNAFLSNYPNGFRADLARAYLKKLGTAPAPYAPAPSSAEQAAYEQTCDGQETLRSRESNEAAKLRFINQSDATLVLQWIDFNGALKEYGTIPPGGEVVQDTFVTHPWITAYQEGSCRQIFLPAPGNSFARLLPESQLPKKAAAPAARPVKTKNCGANASRNSKGDCYCNKNYRMQQGECVKQQAVKCSRNEVYSSSMGQCISKAAMCSDSEVYSSSMGQCIPKDLGGAAAPDGYKRDKDGNLMQDNGGGE